MPFGIESLPIDLANVWRSLPLVADRLDEIAGSTRELPQSMPVLVEVQQHLAALPEVMQTIGTGLEQLTNLMDRLLGSIDALDGNVKALQGSLDPIGRVADRIPGNRRSAGS